MKKKFFGAAIVVVIAVSAMINVNLNKVSNKGDLALANVEALAGGEVYTTYYCWGNPILFCGNESGYILWGYRVG